jgi:hypothetical protein
MKKITSVLVLGMALTAFAQSTSSRANAPIPAPIISAKTAFIANGGSDDFTQDGNIYSGGPNRAYKEFYDAMKTLGRYRLVPSPSDADIVIEIRVNSAVVVSGNIFRMESLLRATVIEPKTHITLWAVSANVAPGNRQSSRDRNFSDALDSVVTQLKEVSRAP